MTDDTRRVNPPPNPDWSGITRVEVIDRTGRVFVRNGIEAWFEMQDEGRTIKVFIAEAR